MITKKLSRKLHENLKVIIQEYMHLNDGTSQKDHTIHDLRLWLAYRREGYHNISKDQIKKLYEEKLEYYSLSEYLDPYTLREFWKNVEYLNRDIERKITENNAQKKYLHNKNK